MARKDRIFTVTKAGRDEGKTFYITEMPPRVGHRWATRAMLAVANTGIDLSDDVLSGGFAGLVATGIKSLGKVPADVAQPLLDELLDCVQVIPDASKPNVKRSMVDTDTEEVATLFQLQWEVLDLHVGFSTLAAP